MKIITLYQPWATLVAIGLKRYETRGRRLAYRGELAIHAGLRKMGKPEYLLWLDILALASKTIDGFDSRKDIPLFDNLPYGYIVSTTKMVNCQKMTEDSAEAQDSSFIHIGSRSPIERLCGDWKKDRFAYGLENIQAIEPFPYVGRQCIRDLPEEVVNQFIQRVIIA